MALTRTPIDLNKLHSIDICGEKFTRSPLTRDEIHEAGFSVINHENVILDEPWHKEMVELLDLRPVKVISVPGTGKDFSGEAVAAFMNRPLASFSIKPDLDINEWVSHTKLVGDGKGGTESVIEVGLLAKAVQGVKYYRNGVEYIQPSFILISDIDRATPRQMEVLRQALQTDGNAYLTCPITSKPIPCHPDTIWYFTANSGVDGDGGVGNVTQEADASINNRMNAIYVPPPSKTFERKLLGKKFTEFTSDQIKVIVECVRAVRKVLSENMAGLEISIRTQQAVAELTSKKMRKGQDFDEALRASFTIVKGFFMEKDNRALVEGAIDPIIGSDWVNQQSES